MNHRNDLGGFSKNGCHSIGRHDRAAFSLLEVILATAIVAASSMVLLRLISTGEQHFTRGERRVTGQRICQSMIDEIVIGIRDAETVEDQAVAGYEDWTYSTDVLPTDYSNLVRVRIRAVQKRRNVPADSSDDGSDFELVRWIHMPSAGQDESTPAWEDLP